MQRGTVDEEDVATATLVEGKADNNWWRQLIGPLGCPSYCANTIPSEGANDFRVGRKLARRGQGSYQFQSNRTKSKCAKDVTGSADLGGYCEEVGVKKGAGDCNQAYKSMEF